MQFNITNSSFFYNTPLETGKMIEARIDSLRYPNFTTIVHGVEIAFETSEQMESFRHNQQRLMDSRQYSDLKKEFAPAEESENETLRLQNEFLNGVISNQSQQLNEANDKIAILIESIGRITRMLAR